jgi:hypothetical protein
MKISFRSVTGRLLLMAALLTGMLTGIATPAYAWDHSASGQWASFNFDDWTVYQNEWGSSAPCELYANSYSNFATAGDWTGGGTKNYAHVQSKVLNIPIDNYGMTSSFDFSPPSDAIYDFMYDVWTENMQDELIIVEQATTSGNWGSQIASNVTIGGRYYSSVWQAWNGANNVIIFSPGSMRTSGTEDLMAYFKWCKERGLLHNNVVREVSFGVEVTSTNGWQQFTVNSFSASWGG